MLVYSSCLSLDSTFSIDGDVFFLFPLFKSFLPLTIFSELEHLVQSSTRTSPRSTISLVVVELTSQTIRRMVVALVVLVVLVVLLVVVAHLDQPALMPQLCSVKSGSLLWQSLKPTE